MKITELLVERYNVNVQRLCKKQKIDRHILADTMGVHEQYLYQIERGLKTPSLEMVARTAAALGVDPIMLLKEVKT